MTTRKKKSSGSFLSWIFDNEDGESESLQTEELEDVLKGIKHPLSLRNPIDMHEKLMNKETSFMAE